MAHTLVSRPSSLGLNPGERLCCVLGQDTLLSLCLSPSRCIHVNGYQQI